MYTAAINAAEKDPAKPEQFVVSAKNGSVPSGCECGPAI
jgi:hypothetical protein